MDSDGTEDEKAAGVDAPGTFLSAGVDGVLVGASEPMQRLFSRILKVAPTRLPVLVTGEPGTGKALVARAIHHASRETDAPFVAVDCVDTLPERMEPLLFGEIRDDGVVRRGLFLSAAPGTVFLDEVAETPTAVQSLILQILRDKLVSLAGGGPPSPPRVRIMASSCRVPGVTATFGPGDPTGQIEIVPIHVPPLRERAGDVPLLFRHFLGRFFRRMGKTAPDVSRAALALLERHPWPGNVEELSRAAYWIAVRHASGPIGPEHLPPDIGMSRAGDFFALPGDGVALEDLEKSYIRHVLSRTGGGIQKAASILGINRKTLSLKMKRYGLSARD